MAAGGFLEVHSQPMVGSDFTFTMDVKEANNPKPVENERMQKAINGRNQFKNNDKEQIEEEKFTKQIKISSAKETGNSI